MGYWEKDEYGNWFFCGGRLMEKVNRKKEELNVRKFKLEGANGLRRDEVQVCEREDEQEATQRKAVRT